MKINYLKIFLFVVAAIAVEALCVFIGSTFISTYLKQNIVSILITLMAINTATSAFIVSKLQEIANQYNTKFTETYCQVKLSLFEQIVLIIISIILLTILDSSEIKPHLSDKILYVFDTVLIFVFIYSIEILRDTGVAMFDILIELDGVEKPPKKDCP